jgi:tetratricopeptide (TPR) repeat protein
MATGCPDETELTDFVQGLLEEEALARLEAHLDGCATCRQVVVMLAGGEGHPTEPAAPSTPGPGLRLTRGMELGRYVLLDRIGLGGMGVVFAAYDPELDRKVALKLLRSDWAAGPAAADARARLWREAQALARLSHPHVVTVHDVGVHGESLFIAMDFVDGVTLSRWLRAEPRSWMEVLDCFVQAGLGLAAAHAAGLVHRDFKPDNVLVGQDGRVRVTDFGLARVSQTPAEAAASASGGSSGGGSPQLVTQQGALVGTPAYMAPEQIDGRPSDARSDQFSFCVALYEGLYGERPFTGDSPSALARAARESRPAPPRDSRVPTWVRRAVLQGLAADPAERHSSMDVLLAALTRRPRQVAWRRAGAVVAAATLIGAGVGFWGARQREATRCTSFEQRLAGVWDADRKARLESAFKASGLPLSEAAWASTSRTIEAYTSSLVAMERDSCEATYVRGEQSERLLDLRGACLDRRRESLRAAVDLMLQGDRAVLERAPEAAHALPDLHRCADRSALTNVAPLPEDPAVRQRLSALQSTVVEANALFEAGQNARALARVKEAVEGLSAVGYQPHLAAAQHLLGRVESASGHFSEAWESFHEAHRAALAGRDDELLVRALLGKMQVELEGRGQFAEAERSARLAQAALERLGATEASAVAAELHRHLGNLYYRQGEHARAMVDLRRSLELREKALGPEHPSLADPLTGLGLVLNAQGRYEEALGSYQRALAIHQRAYGPEHPLCAIQHSNIATALRLQGKVAEAVTRYGEALTLSERALGPEHPATSMVRVNLGDALLRQGKAREALVHYEKALAGLTAAHGRAHPRVTSVLMSIGNARADLGETAQSEAAYTEVLTLQQQLLGPEHPDLALTYNNLGSLMRDMARNAEARRLFLRARELWEKALGPEHPKVASVVQNLASVDLEEGRTQAALAGFQRSLAIRQKALGPEHPKVVQSLTLVGEATLRVQGARAALEPLERAVALAAKVELPPVDRGKALSTLARALWEAGGDRKRALALAREAQEAYGKSAQLAARELRELEAWLAKR